MVCPWARGISGPFRGSLRQVVAQGALDFPRVEALAIVKTAEDGFDDPLGVVLPLVLDETVEVVLPGERAITAVAPLREARPGWGWAATKLRP